MPRIEAVLFDIDGTLLDTRDAWVESFDRGLSAIGKQSLTGSEAAGVDHLIESPGALAPLLRALTPSTGP